MHRSDAQMNYTNLTMPPVFGIEQRTITDLELFRQYCTSYFDTLPFVSFLYIFLTAGLMALFERSMSDAWRLRVWSGLVFTYWAFALLNLLVMSQVS